MGAAGRSTSPITTGRPSPTCWITTVSSPLARSETLARHPEIRNALKMLGGLISVAEMRELNYQVDGERRPVQELVRELVPPL